MKMTMGMEHGGLAGREMAKLMEEDIRNKDLKLVLLLGYTLVDRLEYQLYYITNGLWKK